MTQTDATKLTDEQLDAELQRRRQEKHDAATAAQRDTLQPLVDLGFSAKPVAELIEGIGNAMPAFVEDANIYQVLANVRIVLEGANQVIAARLRQIEMPPPVA